MVARLGTVQLRIVEAVYEEAYVDGPVHTFCDIWVLEKTKWRRRRSKQRGQGAGEDVMRPQWDEEFEVDKVRDDSKVVVDVWNCAGGADASNDFFGKVTLKLSELLVKPTGAWHELLPGRIHVQLRWQPTSDGEPTGESVLLTLPEVSGAPAAGLGAFKAPPTHLTDVLVGARPTLSMDHYDYTHRGGSGHGPKENQDAFFVLIIDERNRVYGVLDGHGGEHGRVASHAASAAMQKHLRANFDRLRTEPERVMTEVFEAAHSAIWEAVKAMPDVFERDGMLCTEVDEEEWPLGYDAADGNVV